MTNHTFPNISSVEQVRDYLTELVRDGKGSYMLVIREHYLACIPEHGNRFDDDDHVAFLTGVF